MNNKLATITTQYRKFNDNQALTADQLNEFIDFFEDQDRLTRTRLNGVGLACGFKTNLIELHGKPVGSRSILNITQGIGVTTDGDILTLRDATSGVSNEYGEQEVSIAIKSQEYTHYRVYNDKQQYPHFIIKDGNKKDIGKTNLWELSYEKKDGFEEIPLGGNSKSFNIKDKVVLLYLESYANETEDPCKDADCDNQGEEQVANLRVLLTDKVGANNITKALNDSIYSINESYEKLHGDSEALPEVEVARVILSPDIDTPDQLKIKFQNAISLTNVTGLVKGIKSIVSTFGLSVNIDGNKLKSLIEGALPISDFQYRYDLLKDLVNTYNEVKSLLLCLKFQCNPDVNSFAKHILLGPVNAALKLEDNTPYRHDFYKSPILANGGENYKRLIFLVERFKEKIDSSFTKTLSRKIKITPSQNSVLLGNRAIPFYYNVNRSLVKKWNFEKTKTRKELYNLSYYTENLSKDSFIQKPLSFCLENYDFFRIEGHLGLGYEFVYEEIVRIKTKYGLPFQIVAIGLNEIDKKTNPPVAITTSEAKANLSEIQKALSSGNQDDIRKAIENVSILNKQFERLRPIEEFKPVRRVGRDGVSGGERLRSFDRAIEVTRDRNEFGIREESSRSRQETTEGTEFIEREIIGTGDGRIEGNGGIIKEGRPPALPLIPEKEEEIETELLKDFMERHVGLSHMGGVEFGGTFVLLYHVVGDRSLVVADFSLPYICCSKKDPVLLSIPADKICAYEDPIPLAIIPLDGEIIAYVGNTKINAIIKKGDQNLFDPGKVSSSYYGEEITFKVNEEAVESQITVYPAPDVNVTVGNIVYDDNSKNATVTFNVSSVLNPSLGNLAFAWNFTDGNQSIAFPTNGSIQHTYKLTPGEEGKFKPEVIISNISAGENSCKTIINLEVSLKLVINKDTKIWIYFDNSGSMDSALHPLRAMKDDESLLKKRLLKLYDNDEILYNKNVKIINMSGDNEHNTPSKYEQTFSCFNLKDQRVPDNGKGNIITLVFQDEAGGAYYNGSNLREQLRTDLNNLKQNIANNFGTNNPNYFRGVLFHVTTNYADTRTYSSMLNDIETGVGKFNGTNYPNLKNEIINDIISFKKGIEPGTTTDVTKPETVLGSPKYYLKVITDALIGLGFDQLKD